MGPLPFWRRDLPPRLVLVSDLDHTMVQNEDPTHTHLLDFNATWHSACGHDCLLVYSTGRSPHLYRELWEEAPLLTPDVLICSVGTEIFYLAPTAPSDHTSSSNTQAAADRAPAQGHGHPPQALSYQPDEEWEEMLDRGWDAEAVLRVARRFPELKRQVASEQRRHKLSFHLELPLGHGAPRGDAVSDLTAPRTAEAVLGELQDALKKEGLDVKVVYSGGRDVDLLAAGAGKGRALAFLLGKMAKAGCAPTEGVQVNGDSGNDIELFQVEGPEIGGGTNSHVAMRGCVVANAYPELAAFADAAIAQQQQQQQGGDSSYKGHCTIFKATLPCAGGILQALRHFGSLPSAAADLPLEACVRAAAHVAVAGLTARPVMAGGREEAEGGKSATENAGRGGGGGRGAGSGLQGLVGELAAAAVEHGVWLDRVVVVAPGGKGVQAGGGAGLGAGATRAPGNDTGGGAGGQQAAEAASEGTWRVDCQVFRLAANGRRDTSSMCCCAVAVRPDSTNTNTSKPQGAHQDTAGASGGGGGGGLQVLLQQLGHTAECSGLCPIGMQDVVLPPGV